METESKKIFVGGLSWETTAEALKNYFSNYGEVTDSVIMKDAAGKPRGFGFITFADKESVAKAVMPADKEKNNHVLDGKRIDPKVAVLQSSDRKSTVEGRVKKMFLGGISADTTEEQIKKVFNLKSKVVEVDLKVDKISKRGRGFGFIELESEDDVERFCEEQFITINGKKVEMKKAEPRYASNSGQGPSKQSYGQGQYSQNYGGRGGYGAYSYPYPQTQYGSFGYGGGSYPQSYNQMYTNNPNYSQANYGQGSGYGYSMQGQSYGYGTGFENSGSEQRGGDPYSMQRAYAYGSKKSQQQMSGSYNQDVPAYNQGNRTGYSNNSEGYNQNAYTYGSTDVNATAGYGAYHSSDKQSGNFTGSSRGGQQSRGPPSQYGTSSGFGGSH